MNRSGKSRLPRQVPVSSRIGEWWTRYRLLNELAGCDSQEQQRLLREMNLTEHDLAAGLRFSPHTHGLLARMLTELGLEHDGVEALYPAVAWDLNRVCAACTNKKRCRRELESSTARENFREFCFNAMTLDALAADPVRRAKEVPDDRCTLEAQFAGDDVGARATTPKSKRRS